MGLQISCRTNCDKSDPDLMEQRLWDQLVSIAEILADRRGIAVGSGLVKSPSCIITFAMTKAATQHCKEADGSSCFIVTVHDHEAIGAAVLKLEALGIDVERVMKRTGVLGGRGPGHLLPQIAALPGVKHVRTEHGFQLPPMHEGIPQ